MKLSNLVRICTAAILAVADSSALAANEERNDFTGPVGICQGALPQFETAIRKRPLAVVNEGTRSAFVTCSHTQQYSSSTATNNTLRISTYFRTLSGTNTALSCTGVSGFDTGSNQFITKTVTLPAGGGQKLLMWSANDFAGAPPVFPASLFAISCNLAPGVAINETVVTYFEPVGS